MRDSVGRPAPPRNGHVYSDACRRIKSSSSWFSFFTVSAIRPARFESTPRLRVVKNFRVYYKQMCPEPLVPNQE